MFLEIEGNLVNLKAVTWVSALKSEFGTTEFTIHFEGDGIWIGKSDNDAEKVEHLYRKLKMALGVPDERNTL